MKKFLNIIVTGEPNKPYYEILYTENKQNYIGYSSYDLATVYRYKDEYFNQDEALMLDFK